MNNLQGGGGGTAVAAASSTTSAATAAMIKIPRPKFTMNHTNGNHKMDSFGIKGASSSTSSSSLGLVGGATASTLLYPSTIEPPVDYWSSNNSNSSSRSDLCNISKQLEKDCKI